MRYRSTFSLFALLKVGLIIARQLYAWVDASSDLTAMAEDQLYDKLKCNFDNDIWFYFDSSSSSRLTEFEYNGESREGEKRENRHGLTYFSNHLLNYGYVQSVDSSTPSKMWNVNYQGQVAQALDQKVSGSIELLYSY